MFKPAFRIIGRIVNSSLKRINLPTKRAGNFVGELFYFIGSLIALFAVFGFILLFFMIGPIALTYDINHLVPLATHTPANFHFYNPAILIVGFFTTQIVVPLALIVWLLVTIGIL